MNQSICKNFCYRKNIKKNIRVKDEPGELKLVIFDMDGVIADTISSWKYIHNYFGCSNEKSVSQYLQGKITDEEFIKKDVSLWKENGRPIRKQKLTEILSRVSVMKGAKECVDFLKKYGVKTAIVSAGLDILAERLGKDLKIDYIFANGIKTDGNDFLTGEGIVRVRLMYKDKKIKELSEDLGIAFKNIAAVGNSCFDIPMMEICGFGIAFNPGDDCVKKEADVIVEGFDLSKIIPYFLTLITNPNQSG
ncbi:MAG: HAD-IB family phosphatase [Candidatus Thermoplasmatota archaeon]|nr:HAD-IB family phosphatase [Candidatus Thermoplasmatota archaeon]